MYRIPNMHQALESFKWNWRRHTDEEIARRKENKCAHANCPKCHGTGHKQNGEICVHMISCMCPSCNKASL